MSRRERVISESTDKYAAREKGLATTEQKGDTVAEATNTHSLASLRHGKTTHSHGYSSFNSPRASPTPSYSMTRWLAESHLDWDRYQNGHIEVVNAIHGQASPIPSHSVPRWLPESHLDWDWYRNGHTEVVNTIHEDSDRPSSTMISPQKPHPKYEDSQKPMARAPTRPLVFLQAHQPSKVEPTSGIKRAEAKSRIDLSQTGSIQGTNMHRQDHTSSHSREELLESESDLIISPDLSHDLSEWECSSSVLGPIRHAMIKQLVSIFETSYRGAKLRGYDEQTSNPGTQDNKAVETHGAGPSSSRNTGKQSTKRKMDSSKNDGDNGEDDEEKRGTSKRTGPKEPSESRLLACPFCKWSSHRYRKCYKYILKDIARLKQHLSRCHRIPIHCAVCFDIFDSEDDRDEHLRQRTCEIQNPVKWEGVNEKQRKQLEQRVSKKKTIEENWYIIYAILFPDAPYPKSPYVHIVLSEELCALQDFIARQGPRILSELVSSELPHVLQPQQDEVEAFVQTIFQDAVGTLLEQWEARNQGTNTEGMRVARGNSGLGSSVNNGSEAEEELTSLGLLPEGGFAQNWPDFNDDWGLAFPDALIDWPDCETDLAEWSGIGAINNENDATSFTG